MVRILVPTVVVALATSARAASIAYVTDMPAFDALAPCVKSALQYNIQSLTRDACPEAASELQSCVCTKNNNLRSVSSEISASISYSCGSQASDDQATAQSVLSAYCDPDATLSFSTRTAGAEIGRLLGESVSSCGLHRSGFPLFADIPSERHSSNLTPRMERES